MLTGARRLALRILRAPARRALLALCVLTGALYCGVEPLWSSPARAVIDARYQEPTDRYNHAVLGDAAEWGALQLRVDTCPNCANRQTREVLIGF
jgi:hypothetical protein